MGLESRIKSAFRNLMRKQRSEALLDEKLHAYIDMLTDEKVAAGASPAEARQNTLAELGGVEPVKQAVRGSAPALVSNAFGRIFATVCGNYADRRHFPLQLFSP